MQEGTPFRSAEAWLAERRPERALKAATGPRTRAETADDEVAEAVAFVRRSTARAPQAEARIRRKLADRYPPVVVEQALDRCRRDRVVDDHGLAAALVDDGRRKGHAPLRIRHDLERRELPEAVIVRALATIGDRDPEAVAFDLARRRAVRLRGVEPETAYLRLVGYLARRGYAEALARKVAREAVFTDREPRRIAER